MKTTKIRVKRIMAGVAMILIALMLYLPVGTLAEIIIEEEPGNVYNWTGNGKNSIDCSKAGEAGRPDDDSGWIHWVFTTKGSSTNATLTLGGSGSGTYSPGEPLNAEVWHFYTPYFDVHELTAFITLEGGSKGPGVGLVISDYCPGNEDEAVYPMLTIIKELLDTNEEIIAYSDVEFEFVISGGSFGEGQTFTFSVNEARELGSDDGLEFNVEYQLEEVEDSNYEFISISQESITLTEQNNAVSVTIINREPEEEQEEETGTIVIEKYVKAEIDDEEVIASNKTFTFNVYNNETDELVIEEIELEVIDGFGSVTINELPLAEYRVEELAGSGYVVEMDPEDGVVDLTSAEENSVKVIVTNSSRPVLIIEKVLLDENEEPIEESDVQFTAVLNGGSFEDEEVTFSVNEPALLDYSDGLEYEVLYSVAEVELEGYVFSSISPNEEFMLLEQTSEVTVTVVNQIEESPPLPESDPDPDPESNPDPDPEQDPEPPLVILSPPEPPQTIPEEAPEAEIEEEELAVAAEEPAVEPEEPQINPAGEEDEATSVLSLDPETPQQTPQSGGFSIALAALGLTMIGSGLLLKEKK